MSLGLFLATIWVIIISGKGRKDVEAELDLVQKVYDHYLAKHKCRDQAYINTCNAFPSKMLSM